jgi:AcrR family transcriptional regulator
MSPRRSAQAAAATREAILDTAVDRASRSGLESLTIGTLAESLGMSKAGVIGPFGSKEALQLAALEAAVATFRREVWEVAAGVAPGRARLEAIIAAWLDYLERGVFPGGCFLTAAAAEFDDRPGPVRDAVRDALRLWLDVLAAEVARARRAGELPREIDPKQAAFELNALAAGVNQALQLFGDERATERGRRAMRRAIGL